MILLLFAGLRWLIQIYMFLIFIWILMSWLPGAYQSRFGQILTRICDPYMSQFRFIPPVMGIDFSPILAILVLDLCMNGLTYIESLILGV
ncbi:YggT family protein [Pediococcus argentinicus]|uniref:YggT family protein n=1 Tax=Pediococcus argentinicus TaxID=480391 RepID=UPI000710E613|nr:YggT family protein [Pediococcus argentinicus]NKZ22718.1 YggT family protein [Pediococcus argentinicus]GEP19705.1 cell division protein [Pediococcus argentinicus]